MGNESLNSAPNPADPSGKEGRSGHTIDVIISVDEDGLSTLHGGQDPFHCLRKIGEEGRRMESGEHGPKESLRVVRIVDTS
jgi:hypothetical protein